MELIRVLVADDHPLFRAGVRDRLTAVDRCIQVVGEAGDGETAAELAERLRPHVVVMDIAMPRLNGIEATRRIKARCPEVAVLVLTVYDYEQYVYALLEAGAAGYLLKTVDVAELARAIRQVYEGESVLSPPIARKVLAHFTSPGLTASRAKVWGHLSEREQEVLQLAARGLSNKEIARQLGVGLRTVHTYFRRVFDKLGVASRTEAVVYALRRGWLHLEDLG